MSTLTALKIRNKLKKCFLQVLALFVKFTKKIKKIFLISIFVGFDPFLVPYLIIPVKFYIMLNFSFLLYKNIFVYIPFDREFNVVQ